ncbi:MAG: glycerol kinase, partial [Thermoanaerobaculia bacterium]
LMQFQADVLGVDCVRPAQLETTALGAATLAGLGVGFFGSLEDLAATWRSDRVFRPGMNGDERQARLAAWASVVAKA